MEWFDRLFRRPPKTQKLAPTLDGFWPIYTQFGTNIYASDVVQQALKCIVDEMKKLNPTHVRYRGTDPVPVKSTVQDVLNDPNELMTTSEFLEKVVWLLLLNYNVFIIPTYYTWIDDKTGAERRYYESLFPINPTQIDFIQDVSGRLYVKFWFWNGEQTTIPYDDVIHIKYNYSVNQYMGGNMQGQPDHKALLSTLELNHDLLQGVAKAMKASYSVNGVVKYNTLLDTGKTEKALKELSRMSKMNPSSPDYTVLRGYLDWILDLPFSEKTVDCESIKDAKAVLDADHFGLEKVKDRIIEYLAVMKLTGKIGGSIICLVGPPGVGKTSVASSIARAMGRKFVRMSLGGVKDEAEIRGHRKTYIGAMPGRIIYGLKNAGSSNPLFLLDEIDKISSDMRGDPASALLEVLDPEQNPTFRDRYLEVPYDLSDVLFVTTANTLDTIPAPLLDRMEVIELSGYTREEKYEIAKRYLVPKKLKENGVEEKRVKFNESAVYEIIDGYTREAGVRNLEREIGSVCRKIAYDIAENGGKKKYSLNAGDIEKYLGVKKYSQDDEIFESEVGSATGLAWTAVGGTTLTIEVSLVPGKGEGEVVLTGKLGDVMKESARAAISFIHSNALKYGIDESLFSTRDIHVHVPEGATPKDGPSAGITMATALCSAFTGKAVNKKIAMTGEITLRGRVLPIGGLKEKALAAYRVGIRKVIIPKANQKDLEEIPAEIRAQIEFIPVSEVSKVFDEVIEGIKNRI